MKLACVIDVIGYYKLFSMVCNDWYFNLVQKFSSGSQIFRVFVKKLYVQANFVKLILIWSWLLH